MKKLRGAALFILALLVIGLFPASAWAYGHWGNHSNTGNRLSSTKVCTVENCPQSQLHEHAGVGNCPQNQTAESKSLKVMPQHRGGHHH